MKQEEIIKEQKAYIKTMEETVERQKNIIEQMDKQIVLLTEMVNSLTKQKFGRSSEKTTREDVPDGQLSLFDEAENMADKNAGEPDKKTIVKEHERNKKSRGYKEELIKDLEVVEVPCELHKNDQNCPWCNAQLKPIGKEVIRDELEFIPAKVRILRYVRYAYECPECRKDLTPVIIKADAPVSVMKHSLASPSSVAYAMYQKYVNAVPLYRQEKEWERCGIRLSRATLANWIIRCSQDWFTPLIQCLHKKLLEQDILHADETTVQVLKEDGKKATSTSYMWLYRTGAGAKEPIVLFDYRPSRGGANAANYLKGFHGYLHTDGYTGYDKVTDVIRCGCWAHLRRKFVEAMPPGAEKQLIVSPAETGRDYCNKLFHMEKEMESLSPEERKKLRLKTEKPLLEAFWCWLEKLDPLSGSKLGKAVVYAKNQRTYLENYLLDGRCSISNNLAENSIRPFTTGRKNWMFSDSTKGADASAAVYSVIETAKANGLEPFQYLNFLLMYIPETNFKEHPEELEDMMPWSDFAKEQCSKKRK
jgi:transposase